MTQMALFVFFHKRWSLIGGCFFPVSTLKSKTYEKIVRRINYYNCNYCNDEIITNTNHISLEMKHFLNHFGTNMILLNILHNSAIYLFDLAHYDNFWK